MLTAVPPKGRFQTLILTWFCLTVQAVPLAGLPLLLPLIRQDLRLTYIQAGSLASANLLVYALCKFRRLSLGPLLARKLVAAGVLGLMGLSVILAFTRQYWQILGIQFFGAFSVL